MAWAKQPASSGAGAGAGAGASATTVDSSNIKKQRTYQHTPTGYFVVAVNFNPLSLNVSQLEFFELLEPAPAPTPPPALMPSANRGQQAVSLPFVVTVKTIAMHKLLMEMVLALRGFSPDFGATFAVCSLQWSFHV